MTRGRVERFLIGLNRRAAWPAGPRAASVWSSWASSIRAGLSARPGRYRSARGILAPRALPGASSTTRLIERHWVGASLSLRLDLGPFHGVRALRERGARGATSTTIPPRSPRPVPDRLPVRTAPVVMFRALFPAPPLGAAVVRSVRVAGGSPSTMGPALPRLAAPPLVRHSLVVRETVAGPSSPTGTPRSPLPVGTAGFVHLTHRLVEERTRREVPAMASATPRPLLVVGPGAVAARRASSTVGDEPSAAVRREPAGSSREPCRFLGCFWSFGWSWHPSSLWRTRSR